MNPIERDFQDFLARPRRNPAPAGEDDFTAFLRAESRAGRLREWSEGQWIEFGKRYGLSGEDVTRLIEAAAGWVEDTTLGGTVPPEASAWIR